MRARTRDVSLLATPYGTLVPSISEQAGDEQAGDNDAETLPVAEVTGAALPPPGRCSQEATLDEEALDEEECEDRYMAAAFDVFMDYRSSG